MLCWHSDLYQLFTVCPLMPVHSLVWILFISYHLDDVIVGTISFLLVRVKLKQMELAIVRSEFADNGSGLLMRNAAALLVNSGLQHVSCAFCGCVTMFQHMLSWVICRFVGLDFLRVESCLQTIFKVWSWTVPSCWSWNSVSWSWEFHHWLLVTWQ